MKKKEKSKMWMPTLEVKANYPCVVTANGGKPPHPKSGTFHVLIKDWNLELRGFKYVFANKVPWIYPPVRKGESKGKKCYFPLFNFSSREQQTAFLRALQKALMEFKNSPNWVTPKKVIEKKSLEKVLNKKFMDPPPRKMNNTPWKKRINGKR